MAVPEALDGVRDAGVEVVRPDKRLFAEAVEPVYEEYRSETDLFELAQQIREAK